MRPLYLLLAVQLALVVGLIGLAATDNLPFGGDGDSSAETATPKVDRFDQDTAMRLLRSQVKLGPRPAGSAKSKRLARLIRDSLPNGRFQPVPGGLRNVVGSIRGRNPGRTVVVGAHYDTKDIPGFVGANDGASGVAVLVQLARSLREADRRPRSTVVFVAFDGEESPRGTPDDQFLAKGLRGSKVAARRYRDAKAMVLLDYVGERNLRVPRERFSDKGLWKRLRASARRVGAQSTFPEESSGGVQDDHIPFKRRGVPAIDLIDFDFDCFHKRCDDMSAISKRSVDAVGETVVDLVPRL